LRGFKLEVYDKEKSNNPILVYPDFALDARGDGLKGQELTPVTEDKQLGFEFWENCADDDKSLLKQSVRI